MTSARVGAHACARGVPAGGGAVPVLGREHTHAVQGAGVWVKPASIPPPPPPQGHASLAWILAACLPTSTDLDLTTSPPPRSAQPAGATPDLCVCPPPLPMTGGAGGKASVPAGAAGDPDPEGLPPAHLPAGQFPHWAAGGWGHQCHLLGHQVLTRQQRGAGQLTRIHLTLARTLGGDGMVPLGRRASQDSEALTRSA